MTPVRRMAFCPAFNEDIKSLRMVYRIEIDP